MNNLFLLVKIRLKNWSMYRFDVLSSIIGMIIPIVGISLYWSYALRKGNLFEESAVFTPKTIIIYYIIVFFMELLYSYEIAFSVEEDISTGKMNGYLVMPCRYIIIKLSEYLSTNILYFILLLGLFCIMNIFSVVSLSLKIILAYIVILILGMTFHFLFLMSMGIVTIWLKNINNMIYFFETFFGLLAGSVMPLAILPEKIKWLIWNPFSLSVYVPSEMLVTGEIAYTKIIALILWCVGMLFVYEICWKKALSIYQAYGG